MKTLIIKLGATGDVLRTTTLLHILKGDIYWITENRNMSLLRNLKAVKQCIPWSQRGKIAGMEFDLVINLEDSPDTSKFLRSIHYRNLFGAYLNGNSQLVYTKNASQWFDISIISKYGKDRADELKLLNRRTYQDLIFEGLGHKFRGEAYMLPRTLQSDLSGDVAIAPKSGNVWPMKNWAYFDELAEQLVKNGYRVNFLPMRESLLDHIADVRAHSYLISGDSLPMHIALGSGIKCLTIFICTSPWEIYDYGLQKKIVSPKLEEYFYRRDVNPKAVQSVSLNEVYDAVVSHIHEGYLKTD